MRPTNLIVIHCSATPNDRTLFSGFPIVTPAEEIDRWHAERGFRRGDEWRARQNPALKSIGYHWLIYRNGAVVTGRHVDEVGAHVQGYNQKSIGICLVGLDAYTEKQWDSLRHLVTAEVARLTGQPGPGDRRGGLSYGRAVAAAEQAGIAIHGHRDLPNVNKSCPGFSVADWLAGGLEPLAGHLYQERFDDTATP